MKKTIIIIAAVAIVIAALFARQAHGNEAVYRQGKISVFKFEDRVSKATCFVTSNSISCVK